MIEAAAVSVSIGAMRILHGVDFRAQPGEVTILVGPNGSGKTTFLKALSGELPYSGSIRLNTLEVARTPLPVAAGMRAVLPQATQLAFPFTVLEVVRLGLSGGRSGLAPAEARRLPEKALALVDLQGFGSRFYQELSGGEQQRVQLARVLCQVWTPVLEGVGRFLFLDEPVSSLDIRHQIAIMEVARDYAARGGGVVAVLHDLNLAAMFAHRMHVMHRGRIAVSGPPAEILTDDMLIDVFGCALKVGALPQGAIPFVLPQSAVA